MKSTAALPHITTMHHDDFSQLVREHHATLSAYARVITRDSGSVAELVQDTFITAWNNLRKFDVTRDIAAWLRGIARNKWRETCRRNGREILMDETALMELESSVHAMEADRPEIFDHLLDCRSRLPEVLQQTLCSCYDDALSTREAAEHLQINEATLRKRLERAREALRLCLQTKTTTPSNQDNV
jgi:RNA polymerase sigma factor CnrH